MMYRFRIICLIGGLIVGLAGLGAAVTGHSGLVSPSLLACAAGLTIGMGAVPQLAGFQYTGWVITAVLAGMLYPAAFLTWGSVDLRNKWVILLIVQAVMFGMGTQMSLKDFRGVVRTPRGVGVGLLCQFSIMPLLGFLLTRLFHLPLEIAAGVILIGSCSSGLASNVMTYLARAHLALSVTVTACATLAAPLMTPLLMKLLAGTLIEIVFIDMMMQIVKIVLVPIGAALLHDYLKTASLQAWRAVLLLAMGAMLWLLFIALGGWSWMGSTLPPVLLPSAAILGFFAGALLFGLLYHLVSLRMKRLDGWMPYLSMAGIIYFTTVTTAAGRDHLLEVGALLFVVAILHNTAGYLLGYVFSRLLGLNMHAARAMALEVGLQNGGMASGIAGAMGKLGTVGLAAAVFSPWMNISGSLLANYWRRHPPSDGSHLSGS